MEWRQAVARVGGGFVGAAGILVAGARVAHTPGRAAEPTVTDGGSGLAGSGPMSSLHLEQLVSASPEAVWPFLSTAEGLARWWAQGDLRPEEGHVFTLDMGSWGSVPCRVTHVEPGRRIAYLYDEGGMNWTLDWRLEAVPDGTRVDLDHSGFDLEDHKHRFAYERMGAGWRDEVLRRLAEVAGTR